MVGHAVLSIHYFSFVLLSQVMLAAAFKTGVAKLGLAVVVPLILSLALWQFAYLAVAIREFISGRPERSLPGLLPSHGRRCSTC